MPTFTVDKDKCRKDGICSKLCPVGIIGLDENKYPRLIEGRAANCISCGHCVAFCPHDAASLEGFTAPFTKPLEFNKNHPERMPKVEEVRELVRSRRSIRSFTSTPVNKELIEEILKDCAWAPTAKNGRNMRWIIVNTPEQIEKTSALIADAFDYIAGECGQKAEAVMYRALASAWRKGKSPFLRGAKQLAVLVAKNSPFAQSDCAIALSYFELVAHGQGVGCCWAGFFTSAANVYKPLQEFLGLQEGEIVGGGQMFGYPLLKAKAIADRAMLPTDWIE